MENSILKSTKKILGYSADYTAFDLDIMMNINSVFSDLNQLGIGPEEGFAIDGASEIWSDFMGDNLKLNSVKSYMYLRLRLLFDPPSTSFAIESMNKQVEKFEFRLNITREEIDWEAPVAG